MKKTLSIFLFISSQLINAQIISTFAGTGTGGFSGDGGSALNAELYEPEGLARDGSGNIYVADGANNRIRVISTSGIISTFAGNGTAGYGGDGGLATNANLNYPSGVAVDNKGNVYIADQSNHCVRKVDTTGIITTIAGTGILGYSGDGGVGTSAQLHTPSGVTVDTIGNVYIADANNNRVRKVNTGGIITTVAGNGTAGFSGDGGQATVAAVNHPTGVAVDNAGNLFIAAWGNQRIRKVNTSGTISTIAGNGTAGFSGDGGAATLAELNNPFGVQLDGAGNLYVADFVNNRIRRINTSGTITTITGNGTSGFSGDGGAATSAELYHPSGVIFDDSGNMYIADFVNNRVRMVTNVVVGINEKTNKNAPVIIYPNPTSDYLHVETTSTSQFDIDLYDITGKKVLSRTSISKLNLNVTSFVEGIYSLRIQTANGTTYRRVIITH
jgi:sugar lactone lactonase YvrE